MLEVSVNFEFASVCELSGVASECSDMVNVEVSEIWYVLRSLGIVKS
jgi:hypothetical protein